MSITYFFFKLMPTKKNRILFLSRQDNKASIDFVYMIDDINKHYPEYEIKVLCKRMEKTNLKQILIYVFHPFEQLYYLATSSICIKTIRPTRCSVPLSPLPKLKKMSNRRS